MEYPLKNREIEVLHLWIAMVVLYSWTKPPSQDVHFHVGVRQNGGPKTTPRKSCLLLSALIHHVMAAFFPGLLNLGGIIFTIFY